MSHFTKHLNATSRNISQTHVSYDVTPPSFMSSGPPSGSFKARAGKFVGGRKWSDDPFVFDVPVYVGMYQIAVVGFTNRNLSGAIFWQDVGGKCGEDWYKEEYDEWPDEATIKSVAQKVAKRAGMPS